MFGTCFHSTLLPIVFRMIPHKPIHILIAKLKFMFFSLLTPVSINGHVVVEMPKLWFYSTLPPITFRMITHMPILMAKLKFSLNSLS